MGAKIKINLKKYEIINSKIEESIIQGITKSEKYLDKPFSEKQKQQLESNIHSYIMNNLCEIINFDE